MIVGLDIGNTKIKAAAFDIAGISEIKVFTSLQEVGLAFPTAHFWISSVGKTRKEVQEVLPSFDWLDAETPMPLQLAYQTPETIGADRLALAVGALEMIDGDSVLVIDLGTCVTYDLVQHGVFLGGAISPGIDLRLKSMHLGTRSLPDLSPYTSGGETPLGSSTESCMLSGVLQGMRMEIEGFITTFNKDYGSLDVILTGGLASHFESIVKAHIFASSKIVLAGLHCIWKFNEGK